MSADRLQTVHDTLVEILSKPPSSPTFFDEEPAPHTLSNRPVEPVVENSVACSPSAADNAVDAEKGVIARGSRN